MPREHGARAWLPLALLVTHPAARGLVTGLPSLPGTCRPETCIFSRLEWQVRSLATGVAAVSPPPQGGCSSFNSHHTQPVSRAPNLRACPPASSSLPRGPPAGHRALCEKC